MALVWKMAYATTVCKMPLMALLAVALYSRTSQFVAESPRGCKDPCPRSTAQSDFVIMALLATSAG